MRKRLNVLIGFVCIGVAYFSGRHLATAGDPLPPAPWPCYAFADPTIACSDCTVVNNCGNCNAGSCDALIWTGCTTTRDAKPARTGFRLITEETRCQVRFDCLKPTPCTGNPCIAGTDPQGTQGPEVIIERPGEPCSMDPV